MEGVGGGRFGVDLRMVWSEVKLKTVGVHRRWSGGELDEGFLSYIDEPWNNCVEMRGDKISKGR